MSTKIIPTDKEAASRRMIRNIMRQYWAAERDKFKLADAESKLKWSAMYGGLTVEEIVL